VSYAGSVLEGIANAVAARAGHGIRLGEPDNAAASVEQAIIWTQPNAARYRYLPPRYPPQFVGGVQTGDAMLDRFMRVEVLIRAPGSERRLLEISDALFAALDYELGAEGESWRIVGPSDGGGSGTHDAAWEERFVIEIKYAVIRERFTEGAPLVVEIRNDLAVEGSGIEVEGPVLGENVEEVL
jgi:hypothetical protein